MLGAFREVVAVDFEFTAAAGERPVPVCLVAHELRSGCRFRIWQDQFGPAPPYATGPDVLFLAYYASAELGCYRVLGWPMPERCRPYHMLQRTRIFSNDYFVATKHAGDSRADDRGMFIGDQNRLESDLTATASNRSWQRNLAAKKP